MKMPEAAIEAAAEALAEHFPTRFDFRTLVARTAIEAAMPAIREAIAQEVEVAIKRPKNIFDDETIFSNDGKREATRLIRGGTP